MNFKKLSKTAALAVLLGVVLGGTFIGFSSTATAVDGSSEKAQCDTPKITSDPIETMTIKGNTYYLISSEEQLRAIGTGVYPLDGYYMQNGDIDLSSEEWIPIGTWDNPFTGTYNGNGFEIKGLTMTDPDADIIGLFGVAKKAHIYNITLRDYDILSAGRNLSSGKSVSAVVVFGQGSRSYDNFLYPKE